MSEDIQAHIDQLNQQIAQLTEQHRYKEAIVLATSLLDFVRQSIGEQSTWFAQSLNNLALLYDDVGEYPKAEPLLEQALAIKRTILGEEHPDVAGSLNDLAVLYDDMGEYRKVEPLYQQALTIRRAALGEQHPDVAASLSNLAGPYYNMGEYGKAERLLEQALAISRTVLGEQHPDIAGRLNNLSLLYKNIGEYGKAEPLLEQALAMSLTVLGEQHPDVALFLGNLASVRVALGREAEAFSLLQQALAIEDLIISQFFSAGSERRWMAFLAILQNNLERFLSPLLQFFPAAPQQVQAAIDAVLRRKGILAEALAAQRDALLSGRYPARGSMLEQLTALRTQIVQKTLAGPGGESTEAYQQRLGEWNAEKEQLEADLARHIPEMNLAHQVRQVNLQVITSSLPHDALLRGPSDLVIGVRS